MEVIKITNSSFAHEIDSSNMPVLIDFFATWCGPCRMVSPIVDEIAAEHNDLKVCKVDVDSEPELTRRFGVISIPTLVVIKNGSVASKAVGYRSKEEILAMLTG